MVDLNGCCSEWGIHFPGCDNNFFEIMLFYFNQYMSRFKYGTVPESIEKTQLGMVNLDRWLWYAPAVCFFEDDILGLQMLPVSSDSKFNIAFYPEKWTVYGGNGYVRRDLNNKNSVLVFNDHTRIPPILYVMHYVKKIVELEMTADQNTVLNRQPFILEIEEEQEKSANKLFMKLKNFADLILLRKSSKKGMGLEKSNLMNTGVQFKVLDYLAAVDKYENKILTYLGINNVQIEKAERLITNEADSNNEKIYSQFTAAFDEREKALNQVNKLFGTNITVEPNTLKKIENEEAQENDNSVTFDYSK